MRGLELFALEGIPLVRRGDDVGLIICKAAEKENFLFADGDIVVVASKIVSKAEGRLVDTCRIKPSEEAVLLAEKTGMDPKSLEVILRETRRVLIARPDLLLTEHLSGFICTKAGVDSSNTASGPKGRIVSLLPKDSDGSAKRIRRAIERETGKKVVVIISDTFGRPDRKGSVGMAIGLSGMAAVCSPPAKKDLYGKERHPQIAQVDEIAAAASLLMGQTDEGRPVAVARGVEYQPSEKSGIKDVLHPTAKYVKDAIAIAKRLRK